MYITKCGNHNNVSTCQSTMVCLHLYSGVWYSHEWDRLRCTIWKGLCSISWYGTSAGAVDEPRAERWECLPWVQVTRGCIICRVLKNAEETYYIQFAFYYHCAIAVVNNVSDQILLSEKKKIVGLSLKQCCSYCWVLIIYASFEVVHFYYVPLNKPCSLHRNWFREFLVIELASDSVIYVHFERKNANSAF